MSSIRRGHSRTKEARQAAREFYAAVVQPEMALAIFFCSCRYDLDALGDELKRLFRDVPLVGCTTAGEIGPAGIMDDSLTGISFSASEFTVVTQHIENLCGFTPEQGRALSRELLQKLWSKDEALKGASSFALLLLDGRSKQEEALGRSIQDVLSEIPLVGGSAGSMEEASSVRIYADGTFQSDRAALILASTTMPFLVRKIQHFAPTEHWLVITAADPARRIVYEMNGRPAAAEYARLLGLTPETLTAEIFARAPVVVVVNGTIHVRSILRAHADGSLGFSCAIERGVVLRLARGGDLVGNLKEAFGEIRDQLGPPQAILGFDCFLRRLEIQERGLGKAVKEIFLRDNTVGFYTFGEQCCGVNHNQTFTCIALGDAERGGGA